MSSKQTIAKNAGILMASQLVTWGLTLLLTFVVPRYLGAANVGKLHIANSLWLIIAILISFGMETYTVKEVANRPENAGDLFAGMLLMRLLLFGVGWAIAAIYLNALNYPPLTIQIANIIGVSVLAKQFIGAAFAVLQGLEQMQYISIGNILGKIVNTILILVMVHLGYSVIAIASAAIWMALATLIYPAYKLRQQGMLKFSLNVPAHVGLLRKGFPYLGLILAIAAYQQVDALVISKLVNDETLGWYSIADQLFATLLFVPSVFIMAIFPALARTHENAPEEMPKMMRQSFNWMLILSVPIGLGILAVSTKLIDFIYAGQFAPSAPVLAVFGVVLILTYQNMLIGQFLIAMEKQARWATVIFVATVATFLLDLILIPWCRGQFGNGAIGGALAFIITEVGMLAYGIYCLPAGSLGKENIGLAGRAIFAGLMMVAATWLTRAQPLPITIASGAVVYLAVAVALRVISQTEIRFARQMAFKLIARVKPQTNPAG